MIGHKNTIKFINVCFIVYLFKRKCKHGICLTVLAQLLTDSTPETIEGRARMRATRASDLSRVGVSHWLGNGDRTHISGLFTPRYVLYFFPLGSLTNRGCQAHTVR
jgi:hypothetical protein